MNPDFSIAYSNRHGVETLHSYFGKIILVKNPYRSLDIVRNYMFVNHGLIIDYNIEIQDYVFERFGSTYRIRSHQDIIYKDGREYKIKCKKLLPRLVDYRVRGLDDFRAKSIDDFRAKIIDIEFIKVCKYCGINVERNDMFMTASTYNINPNQTPLQNLFITEQIFTEEIIREKRKLSLNFKW